MENINLPAESIEDLKETIIKLRFFRHDKKMSDDSVPDDMPDEKIPLTPQGREHAAELGDRSDHMQGEEIYRQAIAFGSGRRRSEETAGLIMTGSIIAKGAPEDGDPHEFLKSIINATPGTEQYGSKLLVDPRLDFRLETDTDYGKAAMAAYEQGQLMKFLVEKSDQMAAETGDAVNSTYTRMAEAIASIIKKYIGIAPRFNALVNDPKNISLEKFDEKKLSQEMHRFFGTHQSIPESFLAKVIEVTKGTGERDRFVKALGNKGFDYAEGFEFDIVTLPGANEPLLRITFEKENADPEKAFVFDEYLTPETIDQIAGKGVSQIRK